jgi:hypothetical protein
MLVVETQCVGWEKVLTDVKKQKITDNLSNPQGISRSESL